MSELEQKEQKIKINAAVSVGVGVRFVKYRSEFTFDESGRYPYIDINVNDANGEMLASVYVEVRDGRAVLVVSPAVDVRDSDEPTIVVDLVTGKINSVEHWKEQK